MFAIDSSQHIFKDWADTQRADTQWAGEQADEWTDAWSDASCRDQSGSLTDLFFSDQIPDIIRAKDICAGCPLVDPCLQGALDRREPWGVWGGQLFLNGRILAQKRRRGRPPKNPVPGIQLTA